VEWLKRILENPLTKGVNIDDPACTSLRKGIVRSNGFLNRIYREWYAHVASAIPGEALGGRILELGSGAGFFKEFLSARETIITSDIIPVSGVDLICDAEHLSKMFARGELRAIVMVNVLHHVPNVQNFFAAAQEILPPGGVISMVEPWVSPWSRFVYQHLHHEPFDPERRTWDFPSSGPMSGANGAIPWMVLKRDRDAFHQKFPKLRVESVKPMMPVIYLASGGMSLRQLQPDWTYGIWRGMEGILSPLSGLLAMFAHAVIRRVE
jgi:hypothetical protein